MTRESLMQKNRQKMNCCLRLFMIFQFTMFCFCDDLSANMIIRQSALDEILKTTGTWLKRKGPDTIDKILYNTLTLTESKLFPYTLPLDFTEIASRKDLGGYVTTFLTNGALRLIKNIDITFEKIEEVQMNGSSFELILEDGFILVKAKASKVCLRLSTNYDEVSYVQKGILRAAKGILLMGTEGCNQSFEDDEAMKRDSSLRFSTLLQDVELEFKLKIHPVFNASENYYQTRLILEDADYSLKEHRVVNISIYLINWFCRFLAMNL